MRIGALGARFLNFRIFAWPQGKISTIAIRSRPSEGRCARHETRGGMRWTRRRQRRGRLSRTAKSCRSDAPGSASSLREDAQATVSSKPGHRGEREVSRKNIARGMPGDFRCDRGDYARVLFSFAHEAAGALGARHSLRPLIFRRRDVQGKTRAGRAARMRTYAYACLKNRIRNAGVPDAVQRSLHCSAEPGPTRSQTTWTPDQQRTTPQARRVRSIRGTRPHINKSIKCGIRGMSAAGIG
jgi:hypothetical protein